MMIPSEELKYFIFNTDMGWVGILASTGGLLRLTLPQHSAEAARQLLGESVKRATWAPDKYTDLAERLRSYCRGQRTAFTDELDLSTATPFQRKVWETARLIPYGETRSYLWIAEQMHQPGAARAVGQALGRNPLPIIIPCHRALRSNGGLGGFRGGLEMKRRFLALEKSTGIHQR
jgi:methylated-DNA-[protein]-cysteine S-methyltransferase